MKRTCVQCGKDFYISQNEIKYFKSKNLRLPKRCKDCRALNKAKKIDLGEVESNKKNVSAKEEKKGFFEKILAIFKK